MGLEQVAVIEFHQEVFSQQLLVRPMSYLVDEMYSPLQLVYYVREPNFQYSGACVWLAFKAIGQDPNRQLQKCGSVHSPGCTHCQTQPVGSV